jgi:uncharacterized protein (TIGR04255 family)
MASSYSHLSKAPITEALLDIRVEPRDGLTVEDLDPFAQRVSHTFATRKKRKETKITLPPPEDSDDIPIEGLPTTIGHLFWNADASRAVQAQLGGFTVNHVNHYETWEKLRDEAKELWSHYLAVATPKRVVRLGLRYINRLEIPTGVDFSEMLQTRLEVGPKLPQQLDEMFYRMVVPFGETRKAAITLATAPPSAPDVAAVILDIDAFSLVQFPVESAKMWEELNELRQIKNRCFFDSLNPSYVEKFR